MQRAPAPARLEFLLENILNLVGFLVGLGIGVISYVGFRNTGSPTLFRLAVAFLSISAGFFVVWAGYTAEDLFVKSGKIERWVLTLGIGVQTVGYFFIAFSHSIKAFLPRNRSLRSVGALPLLLVSATHVEHILRATSFILLVYGAIETFLSYLDSRTRGALVVSAGLALLALGEFLGWYSLVFPGSPLYYASVIAKIAGLVLLFVPVSGVPLRKMRIDEKLGGGASDGGGGASDGGGASPASAPPSRPPPPAAGAGAGAGAGGP